MGIQNLKYTVLHTTLLRAPCQVVIVVYTRCLYIWEYLNQMVHTFALYDVFSIYLERTSFRAPYGSHVSQYKATTKNNNSMVLIR